MLSDFDLLRGRVGEKNLEGKQLLIVFFENKTDRETVLKKAKNLKGISKYEKIYINPDRTKSEQESFKRLLAKLKKKRAEETDQSSEYYIRDNKSLILLAKKTRMTTKFAAMELKQRSNNVEGAQTTLDITLFDLS